MPVVPVAGAGAIVPVAGAVVVVVDGVVVVVAAGGVVVVVAAGVEELLSEQADRARRAAAPRAREIVFIVLVSCSRVVPPHNGFTSVWFGSFDHA